MWASGAIFDAVSADAVVAANVYAMDTIPDLRERRVLIFDLAGGFGKGRRRQNE